MRIGSPTQIPGLPTAAPVTRLPTPPPDNTTPPWAVRPQPPSSPAATPMPPRPAVSQVKIADLVIDMERVAQVAPIVLFHPDERYLPCSVEYLLAAGTLLDGNNNAIKDNPTQDDLAAHADDNTRVVINPSQYTGEALDDDGYVRAPMYVSAQVGPNNSYVDLHFIFLFAFNGPQTSRVRVPGASYNCVLPDFAKHEGDIEGVTVRVTSDLLTILRVKVEGHGQPTCIAPEDVWMVRTHPVIRCAYNSHATYNGKDMHPWIVNTRIAALGFGAEFVDLIEDGGGVWSPFDVDDNGRTQANGQLVFVGLDNQGKAIANQPWAAFRGILGAHWTNTYQGVEGVGGNPLSHGQQVYADSIARAAVAVGATKNRADSNGTDGLGVRAFIHTMSPDA